MKIKQHLYNGLSDLHCTLYIVIWFGLSVIIKKWMTSNPEIEFGQGILLLIIAFTPYSFFQDTARHIYEYGIYKIKFFLGLSRMLWFMTILFCFLAVILFLVFWEVNKDFPSERIYSVLLSASMLFSVILSLLRWHFRLKPQIWQMSNQMLQNQTGKEDSDRP